MTAFLTRPDKPALAYKYRPGRTPTLLFLPGYMSDMEGGKAIALDAWAGRTGHAMLRLDYSGCGASEGRFVDGTLDMWLADTLDAIDAFAPDGPIVIVGSSMGGWVALHTALRLRDRVRAIVGIAAAPDFTDWGFTDEQVGLLEAQGRIVEPGDYADQPLITTLGFWRSGQAMLLLDRGIALDCPVRLLQGQLDISVPVSVALRLSRALRSADVQTILVKDGDHRLSRDQDIDLLIRTVAPLMELAPIRS
jgi:pimeloyl-ACP methyl ester carboxylesterase